MCRQDPEPEYEELLIWKLGLTNADLHPVLAGWVNGEHVM